MSPRGPPALGSSGWEKKGLECVCSPWSPPLRPRLCDETPLAGAHAGGHQKHPSFLLTLPTPLMLKDVTVPEGKERNGSVFWGPSFSDVLLSRPGGDGVGVLVTQRGLCARLGVVAWQAWLSGMMRPPGVMQSVVPSPTFGMEASLSSRIQAFLPLGCGSGLLPLVQLTGVDSSRRHWLADQGEAQDPGVQTLSVQMGKLRPRDSRPVRLLVRAVLEAHFHWPPSLGDVDLGCRPLRWPQSPHLGGGQADSTSVHLRAVWARYLQGLPNPACWPPTPVPHPLGPRPAQEGGAL